MVTTNPHISQPLEALVPCRPVRACPCLPLWPELWPGKGLVYLLQLPLLVLPEGKVQQLVVPGHLQVHVLMGKSRIS